MPLSSQVVGATTELIDHAVDARWLMAYAAGVGDHNPRYLDPAGQSLCAHPLFPVCLEWPSVLDARALPQAAALSPEEASRGVHAAHDLRLFKPIRAGDRLRTSATVVDMRQLPPGAAQTLRLDTVDATSGELVAQTHQLSIFRKVRVAEGERALEESPPWPRRKGTGQHEMTVSLPVDAGAAHRYTECARIWNPIHTDRTVALAAGLPDIILHGTATLAMAITRIVDGLLDGDPGLIQRLGGRFVGMVLMPSILLLRVAADSGRALFFEVEDEQGNLVISKGFLLLGQ